jgi:hypothetical protein
MVTALLSAFMGYAIVGVVVLVRRRWQARSCAADKTTYTTAVRMYGIRRRMEVAQLKTELRRDAANLRRALQRDLDEQGKL